MFQYSTVSERVRGAYTRIKASIPQEGIYEVVGAMGFVGPDAFRYGIREYLNRFHEPLNPESIRYFAFNHTGNFFPGYLMSALAYHAMPNGTPEKLRALMGFGVSSAVLTAIEFSNWSGSERFDLPFGYLGAITHVVLRGYGLFRAARLQRNDSSSLALN